MRQDESGNVLFYILVAVALLAALSFAIAQSNRGNVTQLNEERARLYATEIIEYANIIASGVAQLRLRGFDASEISFENSIVAGYTNANCGDDTCKVFHISGAGITYTDPPSDAMDATATPDNEWHIYGDNEIEQVGTTCGAAACADLVIMVDELQEQVCIELNDLLGVTNPGGIPPTDTDFGETLYIGAFGYDQTIGDEVATSASHTAACFRKTAVPAEYAFYKVLISQ